MEWNYYRLLTAARRWLAGFWSGNCEVCGEPLTGRWDDRQRGLCWRHFCEHVLAGGIA
jgi:hypothetical protein